MGTTVNLRVPHPVYRAGEALLPDWAGVNDNPPAARSEPAWRLQRHLYTAVAC